MASSLTKNDMTTGPEWKHILLFSLPIMAGNLLQQLYNTVDGIVVGNYVSQNALAATGSAGTLAFIFLAFAIGFGNGSGIMIAQLFGARRFDELKGAVSTAIILLLSIGAFFSVFGCLLSRFLLHSLMNVPNGEVLDLAAAYFSVYSIGFFLQFLYNAVAAILRAVGDSRATLYFLLVSSVVNLILDLVFVVMFGWGVIGAAAATVISQLGSAAVSVIYMFKKYEVFRFGKGEITFRRDKCLLCLKLGIPNTIQQSIVSFGNVFIQRLVNSFGEAAMAAFTVGVRMEGYLFVPAVGLSVGVCNFTAQNVGAGDFGRVKRGCRASVVIVLIIAFTLEILSYVFASSIASLFGVSGEAYQLSIRYVRFLAYFFWLFAVYICFSGLLQGAGDVMYAMLGSLISLAIRVIAAYFMVYALGIDFSAVWKAMPIGWIFCLAMVLWRYFSGRWREKRLVKHEE